MKLHIIIAVMTSAIFASACGSDSKKSENSRSFFHTQSGTGFCFEAAQEDFAARGLSLPESLVAGACPATTVVLRATVTRYASCPFTTEQGVPATAVVYSKIVDEEDQSLVDMTLITQEKVCQSFQSAME